MMNKQYKTIVGIITQIDDLVHIQRVGIPDLYKKVFKLETIDGQILFPEVRNSKLKLLDNIQEGDILSVEYSFEGSEKNDKRYNNIYVNNLTKV